MPQHKGVARPVAVGHQIPAHLHSTFHQGTQMVLGFALVGGEIPPQQRIDLVQILRRHIFQMVFHKKLKFLSKWVRCAKSSGSGGVDQGHLALIPGAVLQEGFFVEAAAVCKRFNSIAKTS